MELWIVVTIAAAFFQTVRFMLQKLLSASALSSAGATFARFLYSAPLVVVFLALYCVATDSLLPATTLRYWLFALSGGPPLRPGLLRVDGQQAGSIALEIWSLPHTAFGEFIAGIPAPLAIGTITLSDGSSVKGFICEAAGVKGATDITALGDWRAFLDGLCDHPG